MNLSQFNIRAITLLFILACLIPALISPVNAQELSQSPSPNPDGIIRQLNEVADAKKQTADVKTEVESAKKEVEILEKRSRSRKKSGSGA